MINWHLSWLTPTAAAKWKFTWMEYSWKRRTALSTWKLFFPKTEATWKTSPAGSLQRQQQWPSWTANYPRLALLCPHPSDRLVCLPIQRREYMHSIPSVGGGCSESRTRAQNLWLRAEDSGDHCRKLGTFWQQWRAQAGLVWPRDPTRHSF